MRIAIDARFVGTPGGLGRYSEGLVRALAQTAPDNEFVLFLREAGQRRFEGADSRLIKALAEVPWYSFREQLFLPGVASRARADLIHWTHWNVPLASPRPFVVTIHDLILLDYPTVRATTLAPWFYRFKSAAFRLVLKKAVSRAAAVIVPTEYVRSRVKEIFSLTDKKIFVTGEGLSALPELDAAAAERIIQGLGLPERYILSLGNAYPHKNLEGLLRAFRRLRPDFPALGLVLAGNDDYFFRRLVAEARRNGLAENVTFVPSPDDRTVAALHTRAAVYACVSFVEGFGLPALDSLAAGVPVVAARAAALPEVLGAAAEYVRPEEPADIAAGIRRALTDQNLRQMLIAAGRQQVERWSWGETARRTLAVYRKVVKK
ncbi:glycosyltransferase family 1 protein [Patescibacteria group bacterium]|nr:MAG: glycosyltransferase family 1 protein [Patescibacteria group bacterium]